MSPSLETLIILGYAVIFFVFKENSFAAATVGVDPDQKVISTDPYALVRHPIYAGGFLLFLGIPLALGSRWGLVVMLPLAPVLLWRLFHEETYLTEHLGQINDDARPGSPPPCPSPKEASYVSPLWKRTIRRGVFTGDSRVQRMQRLEVWRLTVTPVRDGA